MLRQWQLKACEHNPECLLPSSHVFFALLQQFLVSPAPSLGRAIIRHANLLPKRSLDSRSWFDFAVPKRAVAVQQPQGGGSRATFVGLIGAEQYPKNVDCRWVSAAEIVIILLGKQ
jgi:hypothetical protein